MYDIEDLLDYVQTDCVIDIYDCDSNTTIHDLSIEQAREWHEDHEYELLSFEPIQRVDLNKKDNNYHAFGIQFNVQKVEART